VKRQDPDELERGNTRKCQTSVHCALEAHAYGSSQHQLQLSTSDSTSNKGNASKEENDVVTPPLPDPVDWIYGFPRSSEGGKTRRASSMPPRR
jgi:hypothetical protein